jgi:hypothetical protein
MSDSFAKVLSGLQDFATGKISSIDSLANAHHKWLNTVVEEARRNIEASARSPQQQAELKSSMVVQVRNSINVLY